MVIEEGKRQLGIYRHRWDGDNEFGIPETESGGYSEWIGLSERREKWWAVVSTVMNTGVS